MTRSLAFAQNYTPTVIDRFGVWLSKQQILRQVGSLHNKVVLDAGSGYHASISRSFLNELAHLHLIDVAISGELKNLPKVSCYEGDLLLQLKQIPDHCIDVILCMSVLEHVWYPKEVIKEFFRILSPKGLCLINVPSWRGKYFLEFSAFRLKLSPASEMNDHKMYYDVRDLWPSLVEGGFLPEKIRCFYHKFGLNTFARCEK